ncbi:hypothetical protein D3C86_901820 [compost metagenome]
MELVGLTTRSSSLGTMGRSSQSAWKISLSSLTSEGEVSTTRYSRFFWKAAAEKFIVMIQALLPSMIMDFWWVKTNWGLERLTRTPFAVSTSRAARLTLMGGLGSSPGFGGTGMTKGWFSRMIRTSRPALDLAMSASVISLVTPE